jgi:Na+-driven multidrug efflux pump
MAGESDIFMNTIQYKYENHFVRHSSVRYIFPPMLGMIFAQIAPLVDGICVSNSMGEEALSAIGTVTPINYVFNFFAALGGIGCGVLISRCSGSGEKAKAGRIFTRTIRILAAASVILSVTGIIFIEPLLKLLCATPENHAYAKEYLTVLLMGAVFLVLNYAGDYILANDNNQNLAMAGDIAGAVVNMVVDYVGVFVFHLGIWSIAFGTVFGSVCCVLVYLLHFRKPERLCRFVPLKRVQGDPGDLEILKPGCAEGIMYCMFTIQLVIQNFVLSKDAGTMGISNSAVIENLQLVITIVIAGATDAIYPMAAAYDGEQNKSGMLMVKRMLTKFGLAMLCPIAVILCLFPQIMIMPYGIDNPIMLESLPFAISLISGGSLMTLIYMLLIDYLSAIKEEFKASVALMIQSVVQIVFTLLLNPYFKMDAPWYATLIGGVAVLIYLFFFCNRLPEGMYRFHHKNLLLLTGGKLDGNLAEELKRMSRELLSKDEMGLVEEKLFRPLMSSIPAGASPYTSFTILEREDAKHAVILRYESKEDYIGTNPDIPEQDEDDDEFAADVCIRSEFLGARRLMIVLS